MDINNINVTNIITELQQIDAKTIMLGLTPTIILLSTLKLKSEMIIRKSLKPKKVIDIIIPSNFSNKSYMIANENFFKLCEDENFYNFYSTVTESFKTEDLNHFYYNLITLKINNFCKENNQTKNLSENNTRVAEYSCYKNIINLLSDNSSHTLFHELFHMASNDSYSNEEYSFCGFHQCTRYNKSHFIGNGLNEGYTQLMTIKYNSLPFENKSYVFETEVCKLLEYIIGNEQMESAYLRSNLNEIIKELCKYSTQEKVMKFIANLDFFNSAIYTYRKFFNRKKLLFNSINQIFCFLLETFINKYDSSIKNNAMTKQELLNITDPFFDILTRNIIVYGDKELVIAAENCKNKLLCLNELQIIRK